MIGWCVVMIVIGLVFLVLFSLFVCVLYFDLIIFDMVVDKFFISKCVFNDSYKQNIYSILVVKIDKFGSGGECCQVIEEGELLFVLFNFLFVLDVGEFFKIFYCGLQDDKECYYCVQFIEMFIIFFLECNRGKKSEVILVIVLEIILVVWL